MQNLRVKNLDLNFAGGWPLFLVIIVAGVGIAVLRYSKAATTATTGNIASLRTQSLNSQYYGTVNENFYGVLDITACDEGLCNVRDTWVPKGGGRYNIRGNTYPCAEIKPAGFKPVAGMPKGSTVLIQLVSGC